VSKIQIDCFLQASTGLTSAGFLPVVQARVVKPKERAMRIALRIFERIIFITLIVLLGIVVLSSTIDLARQILIDVFSPPLFSLQGSQLLEIIGLVLLIMIGVELVETIKTYFNERVVHVEVVLEVALIAIARKVIIVDVKEFSAETLLGVAALVIALAVGYYLQKRTRCMKEVERSSEDNRLFPVSTAESHQEEKGVFSGLFNRKP
jgi:uncharacterized membrane protein (DUF373 family)